MQHLSEHFQGPLGAVVLSLIAFSVVFLVLISLMLLLAGVKHLAGLVDGLKASRQAPPSPPSRPSAPSAPAASVGRPASGDQLIAVLTAAVASSGLGAFRISAVRPVTAVAGRLTSNWKRLSRLDNLEGWE